LNSELLAIGELFAAIEGGSEYWSNEVITKGAEVVRDDLLADRYSPNKNSAAKIADRLRTLKGAEVLEEIDRAGGIFITRLDEDWPEAIDDLAAPPIALNIKGDRGGLLRMKNSVAIVGTRNPTSYGARVAGDFGAGLADRDWSVISGGAIGIDSYAHKGALIAEGFTVAVLGGGISKSYPSTNQAMFEEIVETGLLISEVMPQVPALPHRFLIRNRLIAALSKATVVVEAAFRSGSLRTARDAAEIFRPVMAVPGPISAPTSEGCHRLISERCAELVASISDVMELVLPVGDK
jgi:DNA processing protein